MTKDPRQKFLMVKIVSLTDIMLEIQDIDVNEDEIENISNNSQ